MTKMVVYRFPTVGAPAEEWSHQVNTDEKPKSILSGFFTLLEQLHDEEA